MAYLTQREHKQLGLETMAIQYSLPYALLMWGYVAHTKREKYHLNIDYH